MLQVSGLTDADLSGDLDYVPEVAAAASGSVLGSGWSPAPDDGGAESGLFAPGAPKHGGETLH